MKQESTKAVVDIDRLRYLTQNYSLLQGLRLIPLGLMFLGLGLVWRDDFSKAALAVIVLATLLAYHLIGSYYRNRFGQVRRSRSDMAAEAIAATGFVAALFASAYLEKHFKTPVSLVGLSVSGWWLYIHYRGASKRPHYLYTGILIALLSLAPLTGWLTVREVFGSQGRLGFMAIGAAYLTVGALDHLWLVRSFEFFGGREE